MNNSLPFKLKGHIQKETQKAILFIYQGSENWIPKSKIYIKTDNQTVEMPDYIYDKIINNI